MLSVQEIEAAYRAHAPSVMRRAERLLGTRGEALELVHEVFSGLLQDPAQYQGQSSILTWLYSATTHACLNRLRNHKTRSRLLEQNDLAMFPAHACSPEDAAVLRRLLEGLPEELAEIVVYFHLDAMSYDEIASVVGCSRRTVANRLAEFRERHRRD